jgi:hypothetical protein
MAGYAGALESPGGGRNMDQHSENVSRTELLIAVVGLWAILIALIVCFWFTGGAVLDQETILPISRRPSWV